MAQDTPVARAHAVPTVAVLDFSGISLSPGEFYSREDADRARAAVGRVVELVSSHAELD